MGLVSNPNINNAKQNNLTGRAVEDAFPQASYDQRIVSGQYLGVENQNELLALWGASVANSGLSVPYTMTGFSGVVGQPVRIDPANDQAVLAANSTDATHAAVFGIIKQISTADNTKCFVAFIHHATGLSALTRGNAVYLTNTGTIGAAAGTVSRQLGKAISATDAIVCTLPALVGL